MKKQQRVLGNSELVDAGEIFEVGLVFCVDVESDDGNNLKKF